MDYELLIRLTKDIPKGLDRKVKKERIEKKVRAEIVERDGSACQMCSLEDYYGHRRWDIPGKLAIHHIIPNGTADRDNLITLCRYCHSAVHSLLFADGKWRYVPIR